VRRLTDSSTGLVTQLAVALSRCRRLHQPGAGDRGPRVGVLSKQGDNGAILALKE